ncbi:MAG: guanylate kinase [Candidatus Omnitrophica bacterium]|nr:guanylate kinase [Candidatus Omnitrophota bacterium]MCB9747103.1 guanylate kinase [Candidatus Omnitrophota bacterium]
MKRGKIIIISGPSGSGKTTLYKKLLKSLKFKKKLVKSVSVTTREKRKGEIEGRDYFFVSKKMFFYKKKAGHFLESQPVFDNFYGTPKKNVRDLLKRGKNVLLCIDVKGAKVVAQQFKSAVKVFIKTENWEELKKRLQARGSDDERSMRLRLKIAKDELKEQSMYDHIIINSNLNKAFSELTQIIKEEISFEDESCNA